MKNLAIYIFLCVFIVLTGIAGAQQTGGTGQSQTPAPVTGQPAPPAAPQPVGPGGKLETGETRPEEKSVWTEKEFRLVDQPSEIVAVLGNGMVAIIKENHVAPVAAVRLYVRAGSIYEGDHLGAGMSHLFEHLLAGGETRTRTEEQSRKIVQNIGANYNANTSKSRTAYFLTVPAQHVGTALNLIADWVTRPTFPQASFEREWGVVQRELEMGATDPLREMFTLFDEMRYKEHPARYPVIGHQKIVQSLTRQEILDYYKRMYVPDNCVITVVGDINAEEMLSAVKKEFADFVRRPVPNIVLTEEPPVTAPREIIQVVNTMQGPARLIMGFPSFQLQHPDLYALDTLANIMGEGEASRLYQRLREKEQVVMEVSAANYTPDYVDGTFMIMAELPPEKIETVRDMVWQEIEKIKNEGVNSQELERAKKQLAVGHIRSHQTAEQQAEQMAEDYLATGDPHFSDHYVENMQKVTGEQVMEMARKYLDSQKQMTLVLSPQVSKQAQKNETGKTGETPIRKITLDNGLRVLLKRNPSVPLVNMQLYVMGGLLNETREDNGITNMMVMLSEKGTRSYTAEELVQYFDGIGGSLETGVGNNTFFYQAEVMAEDFEGALKRFAEVAAVPTFPEEELEKLKPVVLAQIKKVADSWQMEGARFFREKFYVKSPYQFLMVGTEESVNNLSRESIAKFHQETMVGSRSVLAVFGDIDLDNAEKLVRENLSGLPAGKPFDMTNIPLDEPPLEKRIFIKETAKTGATVHIGFPGMKITDIQERYPMQVLLEIIGSNSGWLHELLRGKSLVYYAWAYPFFGVQPGFIVATAQTEAEKAPQVLTLIQEQLAKATRGEISEEEVATAKSSLINSEILTKQTNADAAMTSALDELYYKDYNWSKANADRIMAITLADVQNVARKFLTGAATITVNTSKPEIFEEAKATAAPAK